MAEEAVKAWATSEKPPEYMDDSPKSPKKTSQAARPAKVALIVWKALCNLNARAVRRTQRKNLQDSLTRVATHSTVKKVLSTVAQWERHATRNCVWRMKGFNAKKSDADLGLGWWELPEFENYQVGVADATAAMIHAIQFGGAMEFGGGIKDLSGFVKEYVAGCRLTCAIKRYTAEEKKEKILCHQLLRTAFDEAEESRANFEEQARVITGWLPKKHAELKTFDGLHLLAVQRTKSFDLHMDNCKQVSEGWLALQNVHSYKAMSRLYPRLAALERELEETIQSMTDLTNPGGAPEVDIIEEEEPKKDEHPKKKAARRRETVRKRREMEKQRSSRMDASPASLRPQINFEDKEAHEAQLGDLRKRFAKVQEDYEVNVDPADRSRLHHLYQLLMQGQQKLQQNVEGLENMEKESQRLAEIVSTKLRNKYERWALESLKRGRVPTEMDPSSLKRGAGPTHMDREQLRRKVATLRLDIDERQLVTFEERELQEQLEELEERLQDTSERKPSSEGSVGHRRQSVTGEEELGLPTLEPARNALDESVFLASAAQAMAFTDFVQLTTGAAKIERKAVALGQTMAKLVEGQVIGKPEAQGKEWQAVCSDLVLDMEQVLDFIKVNGLPDGIIEKFWQEKQMEIRAAQQGALAATDAERRARRENAAKTRKLEGKLEKELQEQEMKKKQVLAAIEGVWARVDKGAPSKEPASPRGAAPRPTVAAPRPTMVAPRATVASSGPGAVMERILLQHRSDIEAGHKCRKELLQKIRDLEQKLSELVPDEHDAGVRGKPAAELMPGAPEAAEEAEEVVDWMGLNRHSATPDSKSASEPRSGRSTPGFPRQISDNARQSPGGDEKIEEEASSSSSSAEEPQALVMDPWILAFPFDEPALAKKKFDFCKANKIKPQKLHDMSRQKKYQFMLRRLMKQEKRTLALKQKLLLKFLTGDELQRAKAQMKKGPTDLEAESEADRQKLQDRETMISKLLTFWHRRMKTLEDDQESEREAFRLKVKALLEDIHALATVLENAALAEKRKQRINAEDLIRLRQQKAEEAARQQAEEERDRTKTYEALQAARSIEDKGSMSALQKMASFARRTSGSLEQPQEDDALERMRLAKMLRSYLSERQEQPGARTSSSQPGSPDSPGTPLSPGGTGRRASARNRGDERRRLSAEPRSPRALSQDEELQISATTFHTRSKTGGEVEEVPTKTLTTANLQMLDGEDPKTRRTSSIATGLMGGRRAKGTAKRKPSVAQRDSIFANPAAMSRRITGEAVSLATMSANTIEVTLAGVNAPEREKPAEAAKPKEAEPGVATSSSASAPGTSSAPVSQSWSFGQFPVVAPTPGVSKGKELKGKLKGRGSLSGLGGGANTLQMGVGTTPQGGTTPSRRQSHRPSRSASMAGPSTPGTPDLSPAQMMLTVSGKEEARRSLTLPGNLKRPDSARRRNAQSPSLQLQGSASQPGSRRGSAEGDEEEDVRAEMFLKATYMHLGGIRQQNSHPALKSQKPTVSDALFSANGERLFRGLIAQILDLDPELQYEVVKSVSSTERGRCLFIIKNSLIYQARLELEASQRVIHIFEQDLGEVQRQLKEGGPLFPLAGKPPSERSSSSSSSATEEGGRREAESPVSPTSRGSVDQEGEPIQKVRSRRAGMRGFLAFADQMARATARRPTVVSGQPEEHAPLLQIRSAEPRNSVSSLVPLTDEGQSSRTLKRGAWRARSGSAMAPPEPSMSERLKEAQLAADAQARPGKRGSKEAPGIGVATSLASSMLKTMLKKPAAVSVSFRKTSMSLIGDYAWDKVVAKFESNLKKHNFEPDMTAGQWKSHFSWDVDEPLSSRLPQDRPRTAPPPKVRHPRRPIRPSARATMPAGTSTPAEPEPEEEEDRPKTKDAPMLFALAKFMSKMKTKRSNLDEFLHVPPLKEKWKRRPSRLLPMTEEAEEEWLEIRKKILAQKGQWLQQSRRKVEQMKLHLEEEADPSIFERQQRNLREQKVQPVAQRGFDAVSFVRWKVNKQLKQAMQEAERGGRVGPVTRERTAGAPPIEPPWIVGDQRYNNSLESSRARIANLRAKKYRDKVFNKTGYGRGWRLALNVFEHVDEQLANPDTSEESTSGSESHSPRSTSLSRFTPDPGHFRRSRRRRVSGASRKIRQLSVLSPHMRQQFMSDEDWDLRPDDWDLRCWLQPVRYRARTATDRVITPEERGKALSRKGSRSDPGAATGSLEDPVLFVQQACRKLVEDFVASDPVDDSIPQVHVHGTEQLEEPERPQGRLLDDFDLKHSRVMEILERDSLLNKEPLGTVDEEDDEIGADLADDQGGHRPAPRILVEGKLHGAAAAALPAAAPLRASWPVLSTQLLNFEPEKGKTKQTAIRGAQMQSSSSAPSLRTESSQGSLHAQTHTHGPSSSKRGSAAARVVRRPKERRYEAELFHVVARPLMDLQRMKAVDRERRSVVRPSRSPPPVSRRTSQASQAPRAEVAPLSRSTDKRVTVNIGRLSRVLAKQWTEVTSQEVETRRAKMERLSRSQGAEEVALDSFFEWHGEQPEDSVQLSSQASKTLESRMFSRAQNPALNASKGATPDWQEAQAGLVQKHLQQYRRWRTEGRPPSGRPVPLPVLVPKESLSKGANEAQQEVPAQATAHGSKGPSNAKPDSASKMDQYLKGFKDQDLNCLLEEISQTDTFPEGDEFVWPPKREVALPPIAAKGEAFIKALVRGDSPDPQLTRVENLKRSGYERSRSLPTGRRSPAL